MANWSGQVGWTQWTDLDGYMVSRQVYGVFIAYFADLVWVQGIGVCHDKTKLNTLSLGMNCKGNSIGSLIKAFSFQSTHTFLAFHCILGPVFFFWLYKTGFFLLFLFFNHYLSEVNSVQLLIGQKSQQCSSWTVDGSRLENPGGKYSCQIHPDWFNGWLTSLDEYMVNDYILIQELKVMLWQTVK